MSKEEKQVAASDVAAFKRTLGGKVFLNKIAALKESAVKEVFNINSYPQELNIDMVTVHVSQWQAFSQIEREIKKIEEDGKSTDD